MKLSRRQALSRTLALPLAGFLNQVAQADESLAGKACRSVHLAFTAPEGELFYNEVVVEQSAPGTYFCSTGFRQGYFGVQELWNGKKLVIFSVWDPGAQDNPNAVPAEKRVKLLSTPNGKTARLSAFWFPPNAWEKTASPTPAGMRHQVWTVGNSLPASAHLVPRAYSQASTALSKTSNATANPPKKPARPVTEMPG